MKDSRITKLANNLLNYSVKLQKNEKILIEIIGKDAIPLGKELIKQAENIGAYPFFNIIIDIYYFMIYPVWSFVSEYFSSRKSNMDKFKVLFFQPFYSLVRKNGLPEFIVYTFNIFFIYPRIHTVLITEIAAKITISK